MSNSLLNGTTWYWRQGAKEAPIHGDACKTTELYTPVRSETSAQNIIDELRQKGITADFKRTHSPYDVVPPGSLIVFAAMSLTVTQESEKENINKLKSYISENGGKISENTGSFSAFKTLIQRLFGGR